MSSKAGRLVGYTVLENIRFYFDKVCDMEGTSYRTSDWDVKVYSDEEIPQQEGGNDCGVFVCVCCYCKLEFELWCLQQRYG